MYRNPWAFNLIWINANSFPCLSSHSPRLGGAASVTDGIFKARRIPASEAVGSYELVAKSHPGVTKAD